MQVHHGFEEQRVSAHAVPHVIFVSASRVGIVEVREPFRLRRHVGEAMKFRPRQKPTLTKRCSPPPQLPPCPPITTPRRIAKEASITYFIKGIVIPF